mgnify:CR=1 FL=1
MSRRSQNNNRTFPLGASTGDNSTFTGIAEETGDYTAISVSVVVPTVCILTIEQTFNKRDWYFSEQYTVQPNEHRTFQQPIVLEYFRVVLQNTGILQTYCHMISSRSQNLTQNLNIRNLTTARDAVVVDTSGSALSVDISGQTIITNRNTSSVTTFENPALVSNLTDLTTTSQQIKASAGSLMNIAAYNSGNATSYVKIYDSSTATSSDTPVMTFPIHHDTSLSTISTHNFAFSTAICVRATAGYAANDNTAPNGTTSLVAFYT